MLFPHVCPLSLFQLIWKKDTNLFSFSKTLIYTSIGGVFQTESEIAIKIVDENNYEISK